MAMDDIPGRLIPGGLLLFALAGCQGEQTRPVPAEVRAAVVRQMAEVGIDAGRVDQAGGLFKPVDLSAQAAPDWLVDFNVLPSGQLCGTGGCPLQVWVKIGQSPYVIAFDRQVLGHEVARHDNGRRWLAVELHGALCGGTGSEPCKYHFEWRGDADAPDGHFAAASIWGKPARYAGPLAQAMPVRTPAAGEVAKALETYRVACAAVGGKAVFDNVLARLPDLNRDGRPELLFDAGQADCQHDNAPVAMPRAGETRMTRLFTERGGQGWRAAWSGEPFAYAVDFSRPEPRVLIHPADRDGSEQALVWQDGEGRFVATSPPPPRLSPTHPELLR
jgi:hypothetical protein